MSVIRRIFSNTLYLTVADVLGKLSLFVLSIYMARFYGSELFGQYALVVSLITIFSFIPDFGISTLVTRDVARDRKLALKHLIQGFYIRGLLSIISIAMLIAFVHIFDYAPNVKVSVYFASMTLLFTSIIQLCKSIFRAFEKMMFEAISLVIEKISFFVLGMVLIFLGRSIIELFIVFTISSFLSLMFCLFAVFWKFVDVRPNKLGVDFRFMKRMMKIGKYFAISSILGVVLFRVDTVMLSILKGDSDVGLYNAAYNIILGVSFIPGFFAVVVFPFFSRVDKKSRSFTKALSMSVKYLAALALPLGIGTTFLAGRIISLFYGAEYSGSITALKLLIWAEAVLFLVSAVSIILFAINRERIYSIITFSALVLNFILNLILIPGYSILGASVATIVSNIFLLVGFTYFIFGEGIRIDNFWFVPRIAVASCVMLGVLFLLHSLNVFVLILISMVVYAVSLFLTGFVSSDDINLFRESLKI